MLQPDQWKKLQGMEKHMEREITKMIRVYGIVQGVGFRPTVSRHAMARGIRGSVSNKGPYVEIFAQGKQQDVDAFIADIGNKPPKRSAILKLLEEPVEEPEKFTQFDIIESEKTKGRSLSPRISRSAMNVRRRCLIRKTGGICIPLSTVPAAVPD